MIDICKPTNEDYESMLLLLDEFFQESVANFNLKPDHDSLIIAFDVVLRDHVVTVAKLDGKVVGIIGGLVAPSDFNRNLMLATELVWYVSKEHRSSSIGIRLLEDFEKRSKGRGATHIVMAYMENLNPEKLKNYYVKRGYKPIQTQYIRSVT